MAVRDPSCHANGPVLLLRYFPPSGRDHRPLAFHLGISIRIYDLALQIGWCLNASTV
jgi:hypothetical protein